MISRLLLLTPESRHPLATGAPKTAKPEGRIKRITAASIKVNFMMIVFVALSYVDTSNSVELM